ncbi:hypothetical protein G7B40_004700 [Aetokthonos hydrillicola Thurmond2011]|jgi:hypothetical protein|uniref:Uncharacterized protein n=1 Tax=Aetokthonos hydrillicola Thurmond2011 TaxID=2712845 RepID=A0AAP5I4Z1_9CYAN|nr:hypothetical protein [Aetokthonos hydrillicola]MBO3458337.1 hypothetical protein [Aetokthonos hydrillicola CCALA 1050]MBW4585901.1 hypothetical protein [Aetokthonos hydrillicola CCALA 1050]MDR9893874.1 hypothetical protein [Aetokthonos hydrillicola Thurmond2011]
MNQYPLCTIVISSQVPPDEIESLETSLELSSIKLQKSPSRIVGADDIVFVATVLGGIAATADLIDKSIKVAKALNNWRRKMREKGIEPKGKLEHPDRSFIDLSTATDEEIEQWFSQK